MPEERQCVFRGLCDFGIVGICAHWQWRFPENMTAMAHSTVNALCDDVGVTSPFTSLLFFVIVQGASAFRARPPSAAKSWPDCRHLCKAGATHACPFL